MANLTRENAIDSFVQNLDDMKILLMSMSSSVLQLFDFASQRTRFTESVQNLDWKLGDSLEVMGKDSSVYSEKTANREIRKRQRNFIGTGTVQNRPVECLMIPIDWLFAEC